MNSEDMIPVDKYAKQEGITRSAVYYRKSQGLLDTKKVGKFAYVVLKNYKPKKSVEAVQRGMPSPVSDNIRIRMNELESQISDRMNELESQISDRMNELESQISKHREELHRLASALKILEG